MTISNAKSYVTVAEPPVNQNGYLANSNVVPAQLHDLLGAEYLTNACAEGATWEDWCYSVNQLLCDPPELRDPPEAAVTPPAGGYKVFGKPELVEGSPFTVYDGVDCELVPVGESESMAVERLSFSEGRQVDYSMIALLDTMVSADLGSLELDAALELMEDNASALYGGYGVISMPRSLVLRGARDRLIFPSPGGGHQTVNGTKVIATAQENPAGARTLYLTGQVTLIQGDVRSFVASATSYANGTQCTPQRGLAERMYVPLVECMVVKATLATV